MTAPQHVYSYASGQPGQVAAAHLEEKATTGTQLARALEQNEAATDAVQRSADELMVIHAVLKQEIPDHSQTGEVAQALEKTDALEAKIQDTAHELAHVNEALAQEIGERAVLEQELAAAKAALAKGNPEA